MSVLVYFYNEDALPSVSFLIGVSQNIQNVTVFYMEQNFLERNATLGT